MSETSEKSEEAASAPKSESEASGVKQSTAADGDSQADSAAEEATEKQDSEAGEDENYFWMVFGLIAFVVVVSTLYARFG